MGIDLLSLWNSKKLRIFFAVFFSSTLLFFLLYRVGFRFLWQLLQQAKLAPLLVVLAINLLFPLLGAFRWRSALKLCGLRLSLSQTLSIVLASWPLACLTPGKLGDLLRVFAFPGKDKSLSAVVSIVVERLCDLFVLGLLVLLGWCWSAPGQRNLVLSALVLLVVALYCLFPRIWKKLQSRLSRRLGSLTKTLKGLSLKSFLGIFWPSLSIWLLSIAQWQLVLSAFGIDTSFFDSLLKVPPALLAGMVPLAWMGMGTRDGAFLLVYHGQFPTEKILAASFVFTTLRYLVPGLLGLPWTFSFVKNMGSSQKPRKITKRR